MSRFAALGGILLALVACKPPVPSGGPIGGPTGGVDSPEWVQIDPHPCALDTQGYVTCWHAEAWPDDGRWIREPVELSNGVDGFYTGNNGGVLGTWRRHAPIQIQFCDNEGPSCSPPADNVVMARDGAALTPAGSLRGWDGIDFDYAFPTERVWHALSKRHGVVAIDAGNTLAHACHPLSPTYPVLNEWALPADLEFVQTVGSQRESLDCNDGACALATDGTIHCRGVGPIGSANFDNPPYKFLDGGRTIACAVREDDQIECSDGSTHDLGPVRAFSVGVYDYWLDEERTRWSEGPQICVINTDNTIRCDGTHYPPDLQATLAALPR